MVSGLLSWIGTVYTGIILNAMNETLLPVSHEHVQPDSVLCTGTFKAYNALDISACHYHRINPSEWYADQKNHVNGIENFLEPSQAPSAPLQRDQGQELLRVPQGMRTTPQ